MPNVFATKNGVWSDTTVWNTSSLPTTIDDVYANNFSVTIDINPQVLSIRNTAATGINAGGGFFLNNGTEVRCRLIEGGGSTTQAAVTFLSATPNVSTLYSNISTFSTLTGPYGVRNIGTGTLNISGDILGGQSVGGNISRGVVENFNGTLNLSGNVLGNIQGTTRYYGGLYNQGSGTINIIGTVTAGGTNSGGDNNGLRLNGSGGTLNILGNILGQASGAQPQISVNIANTNCTVSITGNLLGGARANSNCLSLDNTLNSTTNSTATLYGFISGGNSGEGARLGATGTTSYIYGNVFGGINTNAYGLVSTQSGTIFVYGNCFGGPGQSAFGFYSLGNLSNTYIYGSIYGGTGGTAYGGYSQNNNTTYISGSAVGGPGNTAVGFINTTGVTVVSGDVVGGNNTQSYGFWQNSTGTGYISGNAIGGSGTATSGIYNSSTGIVYLAGNAIGGPTAGQTGSIYASGVSNNSNGRVFVYGSAIPSSAIWGVYNHANGFVYVKRVIGNDFGFGTIGITSREGLYNNTQNGLAYVEQVEFGPRGQTPIFGPVYILPSNQNTLTGRLTALGGTVTFYNSLSVSGLLPPASSVKLGTVYNVGNSTGTMAVPSASAVQFGVPVDNTVGTAALTPQSVWGYSRLSATEVDSMGDRLRNTATTQSVGQQIASFNL